MGTSRKVYGSLDSPATLKVLACLLEHDLPFDFVPINLEAGEHKEKPFLSMSPFGQVPVYEDGDVKQFEPGAIIRSTSHQYGHRRPEGELIYWDARLQAILANWFDVEDHKFAPQALKLINELVIKPRKGLAPDPEVVNEAEAKLAKVLDVYEARLKNYKYLAAERFTMVDLAHLPHLQALMGTSARKLIDSRPHVSAWCNEILARPAWVKVLQMQHKSQA